MRDVTVRHDVVSVSYPRDITRGQVYRGKLPYGVVVSDGYNTLGDWPFNMQGWGANHTIGVYLVGVVDCDFGYLHHINRKPLYSKHLAQCSASPFSVKVTDMGLALSASAWDIKICP